LPEGVEKMLLKALAKKPEDRYSDMAAFTRALETLLAGQNLTSWKAAMPAAARPHMDDSMVTIEQAESQETSLQEVSRNKPVQAASFLQKDTKSISHLPRWHTVLWITLSWSIGWAIFGSIGGVVGGIVIALALRKEKILSSWKNAFLVSLGWVISVAIGVAIGKLIGVGIDNQNLLYKIYINSAGLASMIYYPGAINEAIRWPLVGAVIGVIGGFVSAIFLRRDKTHLSWKNVLWITLGWIIGGTIVGVISIEIFWEIIRRIGEEADFAIIWEISKVIGGAIGGAIGGTIMIWRLRKERE